MAGEYPVDRAPPVGSSPPSKAIMEKARFENGPQAGPRKGESRPSASAAGSPSYSGGGKNSLVGRLEVDPREHDERIRQMDSELANDTGDEQVVVMSAKEASVIANDDGSRTATSTTRKRTLTMPRKGSLTKEACTPAKVNTARRGRGHTGKSGKSTNPGVNLRVATARLRGENVEAEQPIERELLCGAYRKVTPVPVLDIEEDEAPAEENPMAFSAEEMRAYAGRKVAAIFEVAQKSRSLKGTFVKRLKEAATALQEAVEALATRTESEEARRLRADNGRLKREVENLKADLAAHRREFQDMRTAMRASMLETSAEASLRPPLLDGDMLDDLKRSIITSVGTMVNARLETIEERLLPPVIHRPPLAADRRRTADADEARPTMVLSPSVDKRPVKPPAKPKPLKPPARGSVVPAVVSKPNSGQRKPAPGPLQAGNASPAAEASSVAQENWVTVENKKKRRKRKKKSSADKGTSATPVPRKVTGTGTPQKVAAKDKSKTKLKPPQSAAVVISLLPEASQKGVTYAQALAEAEARVDLAGLGIEGVKFRQSATGARLLELSGPQGALAADRLAEQLRPVLDGVASVTRPTKTADIRISGLDDSATKAKVAAAVARTGQCTTDLVKVLEIRPGPGGMGSVIVQCPISTAKTLAEAGRILVGWSSAKVQALEQRPLRCYRCLGLGHTRPMCTSGSSREDLCFRCGNEGHQASNCKGVLRCAVCADAGRPSDHRMGGRSCKPPPMKQKAVPRTQTAITVDRQQTREVASNMSE
ncbi:uncharacterized protein LOC113236198 [Hyposmocoma kahamanoa]|uniref:uncharacterized protein LOC113236198 n=1 Tax=Hyposmocoma kahamanoa TaxID=1477025 RepID=UPI000E6D8C58|nr:uncharacterized protein LOC113236198 [Hyposmocoma kahamanoa]